MKGMQQASTLWTKVVQGMFQQCKMGWKKNARNGGKNPGEDSNGAKICQIIRRGAITPISS